MLYPEWRMTKLVVTGPGVLIPASLSAQKWASECHLENRLSLPRARGPSHRPMSPPRQPLAATDSAAQLIKLIVSSEVGSAVECILGTGSTLSYQRGLSAFAV